ncbi:hypothetical protein CEXT_82081 [Caerostris extrusa]|uniref:Uncharacterized protein n=1 Tax=Caerostris extrusa TaxID=172846 RepID=A0AAV4YG03_CAEEX|nr:hypothetical protein CEXT_82081 [Caerostris extrusa]
MVSSTTSCLENDDDVIRGGVRLGLLPITQAQGPPHHSLGPFVSGAEGWWGGRRRHKKHWGQGLWMSISRIDGGGYS